MACVTQQCWHSFKGGPQLPERSQEMGRDYQRAVKKWLPQITLFSLAVHAFGDAYDATNQATQLGNKNYDLSFSLQQNGAARRILYVECKYRREETGEATGPFKEFVRDAYEAVANATHDQVDCAVLMFISNIPPGGWRKMLKSKSSYIREIVADSPAFADGAFVEPLAARLHLLVLPAALIGA